MPFFSASASEFVETIVGVGASRVRDLFAQAKAAQPAIVFIDELDAIGRARGGGAVLGGHDEREQTLNQILTEMDGFSPNSGVIVLAATNRPDVLDKALLRPGPLRPPRVRAAARPAGRGSRSCRCTPAACRSRPMSTSGAIASTTPGMVGADLANLVNEAALLAARREHKMVEMADFTDAVEKIVLGVERRVMMTQEDRERTAYHEAGHALVGMLTPGRRSGAQGLDHPARHGARRDVLGARLGSIQLRRGLSQGTPARRPRRARRRGAGLRQHQLGRGVRHPADDRDRAPDGRALGHEPGHRAGRRAPRRGEGPLLPGVAQTSRGHPEDRSTPRYGAWPTRRMRTPPTCCARERARLDALTRALLEAETLDEEAAYAAAGVPHVTLGSESPAPAPEAVAHAAASGAEHTAIKDGTT